jgi:hypothetical protein
MPEITTPRRTARTAARAASCLAIGLAATSATGAGAAATSPPAGGATVASASIAPPEDTAIPYLTVLQPLAVRRHGHVIRGRIKLRAIIAADGLKTAWSFRVIHGTGANATHRVVAHGTLSPTQTKRVSAVVYGRSHSALRYDVTASNAAGGSPTPPQHARIP